MTTPFLPPAPKLGQRGIEIQCALSPVRSEAATQGVLQAWLQRLDLHQHVTAQASTVAGHSVWALSLDDASFAAWTPDFDTLDIHTRLSLNSPQNSVDLQREIAIAMLASPHVFVLPCAEELQAAVDVRSHIAQAAQKTALAFKTDAAERPDSHWHYDEEHGFLLRAGADLQEALLLATQPQVSGRLYDFSCYRATEYVTLLGLAQALQTHNPPLHRALQQQCEVHAIRSAQFHDVFCIEYGSMQEPLPARYYVPGDRLWFRNPDERSADVTGFEGSWVMYMGGGLFSNFWRQNKPFTMDAKCLEIYHWRHAWYTDAQGQLQMDEAVVEARVAQTLHDPAQTRAIIDRMMRLRDPRGVYADGGCIDATREYPRWFSQAGGNLQLPGA
jgi:Protein-glutamine gamma-glutamyltransferase